MKVYLNEETEGHKKMLFFFKAKTGMYSRIFLHLAMEEMFLRVRTKSSVAITQVHCSTMNSSV